MLLTKSYLRALAKTQGYCLAGPAQVTRLSGRIPVWGWSQARQRLMLTTFVVTLDQPCGYCPLPPASPPTLVEAGSQANQLGLNLKWS